MLMCKHTERFSRLRHFLALFTDEDVLCCHLYRSGDGEGKGNAPDCDGDSMIAKMMIYLQVYHDIDCLLVRCFLQS